LSTLLIVLVSEIEGRRRRPSAPVALQEYVYGNQQQVDG